MPNPSESPTVVPYLVVRDVVSVSEFAHTVLGASELEREHDDAGDPRHIEMKIGSAVVMAGKASEQFPPMPACLYVYVRDVDATFAKALEAGAAVVMEPMDQPYGHRSGGVVDPQGNQWWFGAEIAP